jgi:hypothetical protein
MSIEFIISLLLKGVIFFLLLGIAIQFFKKNILVSVISGVFLLHLLPINKLFYYLINSHIAEIKDYYPEKLISFFLLLQSLTLMGAIAMVALMCFLKSRDTEIGKWNIGMYVAALIFAALS